MTGTGARAHSASPSGGASGGAQAADPDWKAVEQALGKSGQLLPGDVFRVGMPRTDLSVTVKGVPVRAGFALGSYAAFKQVGDQVMVIGDRRPGAPRPGSAGRDGGPLPWRARGHRGP